MIRCSSQSNRSTGDLKVTGNCIFDVGSIFVHIKQILHDYPLNHGKGIKGII